MTKSKIKKILKKSKFVKGKWKKEEDLKLLEFVSKNGQKWSKCSQYLKTRNGKQCKERYQNVL